MLLYLGRADACTLGLRLLDEFGDKVVQNEAIQGIATQCAIPAGSQDSDLLDCIVELANGLDVS